MKKNSPQTQNKPKWWESFVETPIAAQYKSADVPIYHAGKVYCDGTAVIYPMMGRGGDTKRGTGGYDRNNKISERGYILSRAAARKVKTVVFNRFYAFKRNKYNRLKFYTATIQADYYLKIKEKEGEEYADNFFIKKFSMAMENWRKQNLILGYVWVAEKTKRGVIHFHWISDGYLHARTASDYWANLCGFVNHGNSIHYGFEDKGKFKNTNIRCPKKLGNYLTKYLSKAAREDADGNPQQDYKIYGRAYGMSRNWSSLFRPGECYQVIEGIDTRGEELDKFMSGEPGGVFLFYTDKYGKEYHFSLHYLEYEQCLALFFEKLKRAAGAPVGNEFGKVNQHQKILIFD